MQVTGREIYGGGLVGQTNSSSEAVTISQCYATGQVSLFTTGDSYGGGLIGDTQNTTIGECWASGSVHVKGLPGNTGTLSAGGLAACLRASSKIENSYALGDVLADNPYATGSATYAGGLLGRQTSLYPSDDYGVSYSFAKGTVTVQTNTSSTSAATYAGGLVGYQDSGYIEYCVSLGETVTAKGSSVNKAAARVYGYPAATATGLNDNYALSVMYLETWNKYRNGALDSPQPTVTSDAAGPHGANVAPGTNTAGIGQLGTTEFWGTTMGFGSEWNTTSGIARGYPRLAWQ
jgi:hypothetical protein